MKMTWKKKSGNKRLAVSQLPHNLPFDTQLHDDDSDSNEPNFQSYDSDSSGPHKTHDHHLPLPSHSNSALAHTFLLQGNQLAEDGKYREALGKWETAIALMPEKSVLHEQKAQVLLEIGDAWGALKAATRATELDPSWAEAWTTLGRAQLNFGEPDSAIASFDKALALKPELGEAQEDRRTALRLVKKREQLHTSGLDIDRSRFVVGDEAKTDS